MSEVPKQCESCPHIRMTEARLDALRKAAGQLNDMLGISNPDASSKDDFGAEFGIEDSTEITFMDGVENVNANEGQQNTQMSQEMFARIFMEAQLNTVQASIDEGEELLQLGTKGCAGPTQLGGVSSSGQPREALVCESPELQVVGVDDQVKKMSDMKEGESSEAVEMLYVKRSMPESSDKDGQFN